MRIIASFLLVSILSACATGGGHKTSSPNGLVFAKPESVGMSTDGLNNIDKVINQYVADGEIVGAVSMVSRKGSVVHFEKYGDLNKTSGQDMELDSIFRIYSMSKPITTVAAMMLYEEGKFQLTDPVEKYLPEFKNVLVLTEDGKLEKQKRTFTIQMLMSHTAGLTYGVFGNTPVDQQYRKAGVLGEKNLAAMVEDLGKIPLQYQPGTQWHYSVAVDVLGRLVEVLSGQSFDEFLQERLFTPLAMNDTFFEVPKDKLNRFGTNHAFDPRTKSLVVSDSPETSQFSNNVTFFSGGGGLLSTAEDYMKFCQMMLNGGEFNGVRFLSPKTIDFMTQNHLEGIASIRGGESGTILGGQGFGLGFGIVNDTTKSGVIGSAGEYYWGGAAGTVFWIDPVEDVIVVVMIQHMNPRVPLRATMKAVTYGAITD